VPIPEDERDERPQGEPSNHAQVAGSQHVDSQLTDSQVVDSRTGGAEIDARFEAYLKQFRPLAPAPLPLERPGRASRRSFALAASAAAAAAILVAALIVFHSHAGGPQVTPLTESLAGTEQLVDTPPLTIRSANALLATAPSFKAAVDEMAFSSKATPLPKDKHSALTELSKEKTKL
jgi:hypothetical protein